MQKKADFSVAINRFCIINEGGTADNDSPFTVSEG